jgi:hypothetical protein
MFYCRLVSVLLRRRRDSEELTTLFAEHTTSINNPAVYMLSLFGSRITTVTTISSTSSRILVTCTIQRLI